MLLIVLAGAALRWNFIFWSYFVVIFRVGVDVFYTGFDINGCPIAQGKWKRHPTCPIGQVKMILWYVQFLKSKMINIELFSVGSHGEFYLNIAYCVFYAILFYFVDYGIPLSQLKIMLFSLFEFLFQ
jgi:hypothetical protein